MKEVFDSVSIIALLFLVALKIIGFENITTEDGILYGVVFLGFMFMVIIGVFSYFDLSVSVCSCGRPLKECRNGCETYYDPDSSEPWNIICPKYGKKHFVYTNFCKIDVTSSVRHVNCKDFL